MVLDIITRDAISVSWAETWELSKSQRDIIDDVIITKIIVFDIIRYVNHHSAAKFELLILQPSDGVIKCGVRRPLKSNPRLWL